MFQVHVTVTQIATATVLQELTLTQQVQHVRPVHRALSKWMGWILSSSGLVCIEKILRNILALCHDINVIYWSFDWVVDWALKTNFLLGICSQKKRAVQMCVCVYVTMSVCVIKIKIVCSVFELSFSLCLTRCLRAHLCGLYYVNLCFTICVTKVLRWCHSFWCYS